MTTLVSARTEAKVTGMPTSGLMLVVGHPKSGKTWFASSAPDSIVIELEENGADRVAWGRIQEIHSTDDDALSQFDEVMGLVMADDSIKTVVIDSVDQWAKMIQDDIAKAAGVEFMGKVKAGVDGRALWGEFAQRVHVITDALKASGKLVVLIAHCKPPEKDDQGRVITPAGINVSGKGGSYIAAQAEMIGFIGVRVLAGKAQHYITFKSASDLAIWRSRVDELHEKEIVLDKANPWASFAAAFTTNKPAQKPSELAKPKGGKK
jgi:hypothetical protein